MNFLRIFGNRTLCFTCSMYLNYVSMYVFLPDGNRCIDIALLPYVTISFISYFPGWVASWQSMQETQYRVYRKLDVRAAGSRSSCIEKCTTNIV